MNKFWVTFLGFYKVLGNVGKSSKNVLAYNK